MKRTATQPLLGLYVSNQAISGVLVRRDEDGLRILQRFQRTRASSREAMLEGDLTQMVPGLKSSDESDFTIEVGDGGSSSSSFLASEFGQVGKGAQKSDEAQAATATAVRSFAPQLKDILLECSDLGYPDPQIAFCLGTPDVGYAEVVAPKSEPEAKSRFSFSKPKTTSTGGAELSPARREQLLDLLEDARRRAVSRERVVFLPMGEAKGNVRYLAIVPNAEDDVVTTLGALDDESGASRLLDTEVSLYADMLRRYGDLAEEELSAVLRVGTEDTLVLFMRGRELVHAERLRSLTTYDAPETICSRMLLQQDERQLGTLHHLYVLSESRDEQLFDAVSSFFPEASVYALEHVLMQEAMGTEVDPRAAVTPGLASALAAALRYHESDAPNTFDVDLLPPTLQKKPITEGVFRWPVFVMLALLFVATSFFTWRYMQGQAEIERARQELEADPMAVPESAPEVVQARVDSLRNVHRTYTHALHVLDSLLLGSDQWSRMLEATSRATKEESPIWFSGWTPQGATIKIEGASLDRSKIASFARRFDATIERLDFDEIEERRIYPFVMSAPVPAKMPRVAEYLQEVGSGNIPTDTTGWEPTNARLAANNHEH